MQPSILKSLKPDIIVEMLEMAVAFENWNKVLETADVLYQCVMCIREDQVENQGRGALLPSIQTERPLVYYIGISYMMQGVAYQKMGQIDQARACIYRYANLECMEQMDEAEMQIVQEFKRKAEVSRYALEIEAGQVELLEGYVNLLLEYREEGSAGLTVMTEAAVRHGWRVDFIIQMLEEQLDGLDENFDSSNNDNLYQYCYQRALYEQWMGRPQGAVEYILKAMRAVDRRGVERHMIRCLWYWNRFAKQRRRSRLSSIRQFWRE